MVDIDVVAPHFKRRLSGVTSTINQLIPHQSKKIKIAVLGPGLPKGLPKVSGRQVFELIKKPYRKSFRIWYVRRNIEMSTGILLIPVFRQPLRVNFYFRSSTPSLAAIYPFSHCTHGYCNCYKQVLWRIS